MNRNTTHRLGVRAAIRPGEERALAWSAVLFFLILCGYYLVRPVRDAIATEFPRDQLGDLVWITLAATLIANPILAVLATFVPRRTLVPITYAIFVALLGVVFVAMRAPDAGVRLQAGRALYIGVSVLNLFLMTLFWALMSDGFTLSRSKRLFGFIAAAGTLGAVAGASGASFISSNFGRDYAILTGGVLIALCIPLSFITRRAMADMPPAPDEALGEHNTDARKPVGGRFWDGFVAILRSPILAGITLYLFFIPFTQTLIYFKQVEIVDASGLGPDQRAAYLASVDLWVNIVALLMQILLTGRLIRFIGVGGTLVTLPIASCAGLAALAFAPSLAALTIVRVAQRATNFALARPARETLFTVVSPAERFKAKPVIDTFIYRAADGVGERVDKGIGQYTLYLLPPVLIAWSAIGLTLGALQRRKARRST